MQKYNVKGQGGLSLIGGTPLVELVNFKKKYNLKANIFGKFECMNLTSSVKDRAVFEMLNMARENGELNGNSTIIEATSGNTGVALSAIGGAMGYKVVIVMPDNMSIERVNLIKAYGGEVVRTKAAERMAGSIAKAKEILENTENAIMLSQFTNKYNVQAHKKTTGPEIWNDLNGEVHVVVSGIGTGGTITGIGEYLKEQDSSIKMIGVEPESSPVLSGGEAGPHKIQGIGAGFVPEILNRDVIDEIIKAPNEGAYDMVREIAKLEGVLLGISSGAALFSAKEYAGKIDKEENIVVILPDTGERYLSTDLWD